MTKKLRFGSRLAPERISVRFDGSELAAQAGDSAASALLAVGKRVVGRSVKYHRPRGIFSAGFDEPNALLTVGMRPHIIPNVPAPQLQLRDGIVLRSQNRWPSLRYDAGSLLRLGGGMLSAGFYYKTFMWPSWRTYEGVIRRMAGLGAAPRASRLPGVQVEHIETDVLIAGAGPAGLVAALTAVRSGARVVLCERESSCGGELEFEGAILDGRTAVEWIKSTLRELSDRGCRILTETAVISATDGFAVAERWPGDAIGNGTLYRIQSRARIVATGSTERPIVFVDNDRPGVMLLGSAERYLARYGVRVGREAVVFGNHDRVYAATLRLRAAGVGIRAIVDTRSAAAMSSAGPERDSLRSAGIECLSSHAVLAAQGRQGVQAAIVAPLDDPSAQRRILCDAILVSGGWSSAAHASDKDHSERRIVCGAAAGNMELRSVVADAFAAGQRAARIAEARGDTHGPPYASGDPAPRLSVFWRSPATLEQEKFQFVDFQNDVTVSDLRQAVAEGFHDIEHVKRYTALGMGTEQGATSRVVGAAIVAEFLRRRTDEPAVSRARPPYQPVTLMTLAGLRVGAALRPERRTALHDWHVRHGGVMEPADLWMRPRYYRENGADASAAGIAEAARVRAAGGIFDASTLGKIEIGGPVAAAFLDGVYVSRASSIKVGGGKYMVCLREDGMVLDDGIVVRVAEDRFVATTSTAHAGQVLSHFEHCLATYPTASACALTDVTEAWSVIVVSGPNSREKLRSVLGVPLADSVAALARMQLIVGRWRDSELRVLRASFSGELAYELHCRPSCAATLWQSLVDSGLAPYGLEALDILRVEKGYLTASEMNGQTTPFDLGLDSMLNPDVDYVGRQLLGRPAFHQGDRPCLVGLRCVDRRKKFLPGAAVVTSSTATSSVGHVTSAVYSPALEQWIGLALVARNQAAYGNDLLALDPLRALKTSVVVVPAVHFDPESARMKA